MIGQDTALAAEYLKKGSLVAIPTETVYGLAGNAFDEKAVADIFRVKNRPFFDPLIVHLASPAALESLTEEIPPLAYELAAAFWPGPLTLLLKKSAKISSLITAGSPFVAVRMPDHPLTLKLLSSLDFPVAAPSANPFGYISPTTASHVSDQLGARIPYILDGGVCERGIESTIVGFDGDKIVLYRQGAVTEEQLQPFADLVFKNQGPAPGLLKSHYAPRKPLFLGNIPDLLKDHPRCAVLSFKTLYDHPNILCQKALSLRGDLQEAAFNLFAFLRILDAEEVSCIVAEKVPSIGIGRALNDRLEKAAAKKEAMA